MYKGTIRSLSYAIRVRVVSKYYGQFCIVAAVLTSINLLVSILSNELNITLRYFLTFSALFAVGASLGRREAPRDIQVNEALVLTSLIFITMPLILTPAMMGAGLSFMDAFFEAVSGMTTTGLSTLPMIEDKGTSFLFARSWLQWSGGLGIVVLTVALILRPGMTARRLVDLGVDNDVIGGTKIYARRILIVYVLLTLFGFLVILISGEPPFSALIHCLAAVSTGGFSCYDRSLGSMGSWVPRAGVIAVSAMGSISLILYYNCYRNGFGALIKDIQLRTIVVLSALSIGLLWAILHFQADTLPAEGGHAALMAVSAQTTSGFSSLPISDLSPAAKLAMILSMLIGGGIGSTAGGIKILRILILLEMLKLTFVRTCIPSHTVLEPRLAGHRLDRDEIDQALLLIILFCLTIFISWLPFVVMGYDPLDSLFEVVSATGTVGLSAGITSSGLPDFLKLVLCADMLMGRLEIIALLILFYPRIWVGRRT